MTILFVGPFVAGVPAGILLMVYGAIPLLGVLLLMLCVPIAPLARWAFRDLWLPWR